MTAFFRLLGYDLKLQLRHGAQSAALVLFFIIVLLLLPFAIGPDPDVLRRLAPGLIWLASLLMTLLALDQLFVPDARDGTLEVMMLTSLPLPVIVASKLAAQSLALLLIMLVMLLPASLLLGLRVTLLPVLAVTFILGAPSLVLLGGMVSAITVGLRRTTALLTLLLVPFYIPILIFAVAACDAVALGASPGPHLLLLGAALAALLPTAPILTAAILRQEQNL